MNDDEARTTPVTSGCVWCKKSQEEAADDVEFVSVGDTEKICTPCLEDLRWYKRAVSWQFVLHEDFPDDFTEDVFEAVNDAVLDHYEAYGFGDTNAASTRQTSSNATGYSNLHVDTD